MRVYARSRLTESRPVHNLVVSNVPGPQIPLYFLGAEVTAMYPLGPIFHGSGLNITVMSLNGKLDVGLISCPELLPDLWDMADDFAVGMKELLDAAKPAANTDASKAGATRKAPRRRVGVRGTPAGHGSMFAMRQYPRPRVVRTALVLSTVAALVASAGCSTMVSGTAVIAEPRIGQPVQWGPCRVAGGGGGNALPIPAGAQCGKSPSRWTTPSPTAGSPVWR